MNRAVGVGLAAVMSFVAGCLPGDTRPEPGRLIVEVEASDPSVTGFTTVDGWTIHFDQLLVGLGNIFIGTNPQLGGDCRVYENADYIRLFDFTLPGRQKLGEVYGLGECAIFFALRSPSSNSLLQAGVTPADRDFMRGPVEEGPMQLATDTPPPRTAIYMRGTALRGSESKRFEWRFVGRDSLGYCGDTGAFGTQVELSGGDDVQSIVSFQADVLFREIHPYGTPMFDMFANTDVNGDGEITEEEIDNEFNSMEAANEPGSREFGLDGNFWQSMLARFIFFDGRRCSRVPWEASWGGGDGPF